MPKWLQVIAKADKEPTEILIYDQIGKDWFGEDGVSAKEFAAALKEIPADKEIVVRFNSPGGNVWDGLAIHNLLAARRDKVTSVIDGIAASISSVIALAGRELHMPENAIFMIHDASALVIGNADDMRDVADKLDRHSDMIADIYAKKTGRTRTEMRALMKKEPYMSGTEAKEQRFADVVTESVKIAASLGRVLGQIRTAKTAIQSGDKKPPQMQTEELIDLLEKHGVKVADDATEKQLMAKLEEVIQAKQTPNPDAPANAKDADDLKAMKAELEKIRASAEGERVKRITAELDTIIATRPQIEAKVWLPRAIADESVLKDLRAMPEYGTDPFALGASKDMGNPAYEEYRKMTNRTPEEALKRQAFRVENFETLQRVQRQMQPRAANTIAAALVPDFLSDQLVIVVWNKLASLAAYTREFSLDRLAPRRTVQVRKATTGSAAQTNPTNFETGDTTLAAIAVTVNQISKSFQITNDELNKGHRLAHLAGINALLFGDAISDVVTALMIAANYGAATVIGAAASFDAADLPAIWALAKNYNRRNLLLDGSHLAGLIPVDRTKFVLGESGAFGFDAIYMNNRWTGAVANIVGFVCSPEAIAICAGLPVETPNGEFLSKSIVTIPGLELSVELSAWFSRAGRVNWASYDVMFGAAVGDGTAAENLVSA